MTAGRRTQIMVSAAVGIFLMAVPVGFTLPSWQEGVAPRQLAILAPIAARATTTLLPTSAQPLGANRALYLALSEPMGAIANSDRVIDQSADSVELTSLVQPVNLASVRGREALRELLSRAEEVAELRLEITEQNFSRVRDAAQNAPVDAGTANAFVDGFDAHAERTRAASEKLFETQRQAIATGRRLLSFMEDNRARYELEGGRVSFRSAALQDQFGHYLSQTGQILKRERTLRMQVIVARHAQERLLYALDAGA
jgi:hypothetical protein